MTSRKVKMALGTVLVLVLVGGAVTIVRSVSQMGRAHIVGYFDNSNGVFAGDDVRIMGVAVGKIEKIEPQPLRAKISFWIDGKYRVPADAKAVILSPSLVTARAIQLTPAYAGGPALGDNAVIPQSRTAVPIEWDDFRKQLEKLATTLQPTQPGGASTLGSLINTAADNLRGQGPTVRQTVTKLAESLSILGDHSTDIFASTKHVAALVSALQSSTDLMRQLNTNLAAVTTLLANDPNEVGKAVADLNTALTDVRGFIADNKDAIPNASQQLNALSRTLVESLDDIKQALHVTPNTFSNFSNIYKPDTGEGVGVLAVNNFADPISMICGAIEATSQLDAQQSAKLCVQYLAPIIKNRQYNFPPIGTTLYPFLGMAGPRARPNELTYSEDWMKPDHVPSAPPGPAAEVAATPPPPGPSSPPGNPAPLESPAPASAPTPAANLSSSVGEVRVSTDPNAGLSGMMAQPPAGGGS
ncbi:MULTISPECIES: MCE family protein [Mycobacterium]|uniref:MCE family protein n=1 Tax=Mycobacterium TaxID=1763 RepID=UPI00200FF868|nr:MULTISPECIES: MCE family protein [Mycobacterium]UQB93141.1 MCE family protein [Mycobacterium intracellulare]WSE46144.1 MCE family protein [Mycobacterium sp. 3-98]